MAGAGAALTRGWGQFLHFLLPPACVGCGEALAPGEGRVCPRCRTRLTPPSHPRCPRCQAPRGTGVPEDRPCPECQDWPASLEAARSAFVLSTPADQFVYALKYGGWPEVAGFMAAPMVGLLTPEEQSGPWVLVPVPTTPSRQRARGYNQAELLAREVARKTGLPLEHLLQRKEGGGTQVALHRQERRANVEGAFEAVHDAGNRLQGRPVLLVDDVLTTGATGQAAADALTLRAAAPRVRLITFARSLPQEDDVHR